MNKNQLEICYILGAKMQLDIVAGINAQTFKTNGDIIQYLIKELEVKRIPEKMSIECVIALAMLAGTFMAKNFETRELETDQEELESIIRSH